MQVSVGDLITKPAYVHDAVYLPPDWVNEGLICAPDRSAPSTGGFDAQPTGIAF